MNTCLAMNFHQMIHRDRENSTVFVADLPAGVTEDELSTLFKDVGIASCAGTTH